MIYKMDNIYAMLHFTFLQPLPAGCIKDLLILQIDVHIFLSLTLPDIIKNYRFRSGIHISDKNGSNKFKINT